MNDKIIINKNSIITDAEALYKVFQVIGEGLVSETSKGKQYCFATRFKDGYVVTCNKTKTGYSFRVGKEKEKMKCEICGDEYADDYYKNEDTGEIICEDCLLEADGITTSTETSYYVDGEYIGNDLNFDELINNVCAIFGYKEVKEGENE